MRLVAPSGAFDVSVDIPRRGMYSVSADEMIKQLSDRLRGGTATS